MKKIILASMSPRRKELLEKYGLDFEIIGSKVEEIIEDGEDPITATTSLAFQKGQDVASRLSNNEIVIAADTVVFKDKILGKPKDRKDAKKMLLSMNGHYHYVVTGIFIMGVNTDIKIVDYEISKVKFRNMEENKIDRYLDIGEYSDKAGAYGVQGYGALLVDSIEGSYSNAVGLPISKVDDILERHFSISIL